MGEVKRVGYCDHKGHRDTLNVNSAGSSSGAGTRTPHTALIAILSAGNFAIGMGAFVIIGILSPIADSMGISASQAGWVMTAYAIAYAIGSPLSVALTGAWQRKRVLITGLLIFILGAVMSALATSMPMLLAARVTASLGAGMVTPVSAGIAVAISEPAQQGKVLARVFFGLTLAQVLGVPVGSYLGYTFGWEVTFAVVALLTIFALVGVIRYVPAVLSFQVNSLATLGDALSDIRGIASVLFTASFLGAIYVMFTYLTPLLETTMGFGRDGVTLTLLLFGIGAVAGNTFGGWLTDKLGSYKTLCTLCIAQVLLLPMYSLLPIPFFLLAPLTMLSAIFGWSFMVAQQTRLVRQMPQRQSVVLALNAAAIYLGAAIGSAIGSVVLDNAGLSALGFAAGVCGALALFHLVLSERAYTSQKVVQGG